jgi:hypothetical protein
LCPVAVGWAVASLVRVMSKMRETLISLTLGCDVGGGEKDRPPRLQLVLAADAARSSGRALAVHPAPPATAPTTTAAENAASPAAVAAGPTAVGAAVVAGPLTRRSCPRDGNGDVDGRTGSDPSPSQRWTPWRRPSQGPAAVQGAAGAAPSAASLHPVTLQIQPQSAEEAFWEEDPTLMVLDRCGIALAAIMQVCRTCPGCALQEQADHKGPCPADPWRAPATPPPIFRRSSCARP